ncbi:LysR substrate-binding domain-containing protein [Nocardioides sp. CFH 31398]|uniref:LysR substrate-binding domain-containing protein n=1 Tax=Nocardioides sp. CFH 31398 TaxID=2919579 RepID=UPI001F050B55|nr:LysR substrate-binding domain-containing protein [Nocardioides sp. CFH 31398]MCH1865297.1 LysR substrate-binding domain-containing protein [Nocardioides sp. CFH 31398]
MLEVREARYFLAVAEELHFGRAAERLHMSQPPLSQAIRALERRLDAPLLLRTTRSVALTPVGEVLVDHCRRLINIADEAEQDARDAAAGHVGRLRIGAVTSAFFDPLPRLLAALRQQRPGLEVVLTELDSHDAVRALREHSIDVALVRRLATPPGIARRTLLEEHFTLAVPTDWHHVPEDVVDLATVADEPWVWLPRPISPDYHDQVVACCRRAGISPTVTNTADSILSQLAMVACGIGLALVPASAASHGLRPEGRVRFVPIKGPTSIELAALWLPDAVNPAVDALLDAERLTNEAPD